MALLKSRHRKVSCGKMSWPPGIFQAATAFAEWHPLAEQGNADAQSSIGLMYAASVAMPPPFSATKSLSAWSASIITSNIGPIFSSITANPNSLSTACCSANITIAGSIFSTAALISCRCNWGVWVRSGARATLWSAVRICNLLCLGWAR
jgi:hypothetical protein